MPERLQKVMAQAGIGSRRHCEELIRAGRVKVDGQDALLGMKVDPDVQLIFLDGKLVASGSTGHVYFLLYKPVGYISTVSDPQGRPLITDLVPASDRRIYPVGRLDYNTSGLILLTDDGDLAYLLTHPKYGVWKSYQALVDGLPSERELEDLRHGVLLEDGRTAPAMVRVLKPGLEKALLEIKLHEGKKRQIRRMCEAVGHPVLSLQRVGLAFLNLEGLQAGHFRHLDQGEVERLKILALGNQAEGLTGKTANNK
jgi:23S rRNA pseudouridine2605 synthase